MVAFAGAMLSTNLVNNYLAPDYQYVFNSTAFDSAASPATWPLTPVSTFFDGPGQLSVDIRVGDGAALLVAWGFEGYNSTTNASSIRMGINMQGANGSNTQAATTDLSAMSSNSGLGNGGAHHTSRFHVFTGLARGVVTTVKMQAYMSSAAGGHVFVDNQWLFVSQFF